MLERGIVPELLSKTSKRAKYRCSSSMLLSLPQVRQMTQETETLIASGNRLLKDGQIAASIATCNVLAEAVRENQ